MALFRPRPKSPATDQARQAITQALAALGWNRDAYGHLRGIKGGKAYRIKMQDLSLRIEVRVEIGGKNEWRKVGGGYYRSCVVQEDGRVRVGSLLLGPLPPQ